MKKQSPLLWSKIEPGKCLGFEAGRLRIGFQRGYIFLDDINEKSQRARLLEITRDFFKKDVSVDIEITEPDPESASPNAAGRRFTSSGMSTFFFRSTFAGIATSQCF